MESFDRAWFGCCLSGCILFNDYGIPSCNSNDVTHSIIKLSQAASHWKQKQTHTPKRRECLLFKITWAQISSRNARFIFSILVGAVVWPLLPNRDTFRRCFDLGFHDEMAASKWTTRQKGLMYAGYAPYTIGPVYLSANHAWNTWYGSMWVPWCNGP